ncbi:hypothetical protein A7D25_02475 [Pseudomonas sp. 21C1]|nr:hypothetical protein A7D25_02475 [Pseudomonas sp. 21C1]
MPERGMAAAVGQVPEYVEMVTRWCKTTLSLPIIVRLTPNITDVRLPARAAHRGAAIAFVGEDLLGRQESLLDVAPTNLDLVLPDN